MSKPLIKINNRFYYNAKLFNIFYIVIIAAPIIIAIFAYTIAASLLEDESSSMRAVIINKIASDINAELYKAEIMSYQMNQSFDIIKYGKVQRPFSIDERYSAVEARDALEPYVLSVEIVADFYIYYPNADYVISPAAGYEADFFFSEVYKFNDFASLDDIKNFHSQTYRKQYIFDSGDITRQNSFSEDYILFMNSFSPYITNGKGTIVVLIDKNRVKDIIRSVKDDSSIALLSPQNETVTSLRWDGAASVPSYELFQDPIGKKNITINGEKNIVNYNLIKHAGIMLISAVPEKIFSEKVYKIRNIIFIIALLVLVLSLVLAILRGYKITNVFEGITDWLKNDVSSRKKRNELAYLKDAVSSSFNKNKYLQDELEASIQRNEEYKKRIQHNYAMVRNSLLLRLFRGYTNEFKNNKELYESYDIYLAHNFFAVMAIQLEKDHKVSENTHIANVRGLGLVLSSLINDIVYDQMSEVYYVQTGNERFAYLFNYDDVGDGQTKVLNSIARQIKKFITGNFTYKLTIGISNVNEGIDSVHISAKQALRAINYRIIAGSGSIIMYDQIVESDKNYYYPIDTELHLISRIRSGNMEGCKELLDYIFEENFNKHNPTINLAQCLLFDIMSTAIKVLDNLNVKYQMVFGENFDPLDELAQCDTVEEMKLLIFRVYEQICRYVNETAGRNELKLQSDILKFIEENYTDTNFSQSVVAQHFDMSQSYVSGFFKSHMGTNMTEYVQKLRVKKAEELLQNTSYLLAEIAEMVGYTSDKTLIRVFKRYQNMTPGCFRDRSLL